MQEYSGIALRVDLSKQGGPYSSCPSIAATYQQFYQLIAVTLSCVSLHRAWTGGLQQADCYCSAYCSRGYRFRISDLYIRRGYVVIRVR
jgi:hypothetical protein